MKYKIIYDRKGCIGAAACTVACPKYWKMNPDGKADLIGSKYTDDVYELELTEEKLKEHLKAAVACNKDAAESCPANVIRIVDEKGKDLV